MLLKNFLLNLINLQIGILCKVIEGHYFFIYFSYIYFTFVVIVAADKESLNAKMGN